MQLAEDPMPGIGDAERGLVPYKELLQNIASFLIYIQYSLAWDIGHNAFKGSKDLYFDKEQRNDYIKDQKFVDETGRGYEIWPKIDTWLTRIEKLLQELEVGSGV